MKPHKRNGKQAAARRKKDAEERKEHNKRFMDKYESASPEERLIMDIFSKPELTTVNSEA